MSAKRAADSDRQNGSKDCADDSDHSESESPSGAVLEPIAEQSSQLTNSDIRHERDGCILSTQSGQLPQPIASTSHSSSTATPPLTVPTISASLTEQNGSEDEIDRSVPVFSTHSIGEVKTDQHMVHVQSCAQPMIGSQFYAMKSNPRGYCLIFNIIDFPDHSIQFPHRLGSESEGFRLKKIFEQLHFEVNIIKNPNKKDIETTVEEYSQKEELLKHDCFVLIVLSHGKDGGVFVASDGLYIAYKDIVEQLNNRNCKNLIKKPKLFFFSCCRGHDRDYGVDYEVEALTQTMNLDSVTADAGLIPMDRIKPQVVRVPVVSDVMICYSTIDGYVSWRHEENGTWLGMALCKVLTKSAHTTELLQLLTQISDEVSLKESDEYGAKQVVEVIQRGFTKQFYFNPGYFADSSSSTN
ncbi:unnamed protein product [Medioppia subpectinata]|uniref:Caspase-3 n=1 Tax=Medioppia subpectinata TaxID=1979941 RepID=A0A7R9Q6J5_9ACAR|nr:unnamed protein product [Medioppia subpectinata]CAG2114935.1 unnamed protein product [Medioppia subpectinata]